MEPVQGFAPCFLHYQCSSSLSMIYRQKMVVGEAFESSILAYETRVIPH